MGVAPSGRAGREEVEYSKLLLSSSDMLSSKDISWQKDPPSSARLKVGGMRARSSELDTARAMTMARSPAWKPSVLTATFLEEEIN